MRSECKWGKGLAGIGIFMLLAVFMALPVTVNAKDEYAVVDGQYFMYKDLGDGTVSIIFSNSGSKDKIVFPPELNGKKVTAIDRFSSRLPSNALKTVDLPDTLTRIGNDVFSNCPNLQSVNIPKGVVSIGNKAFYGCKNIRKIELPEGLESIGDSAFANCKMLESVTIPASVTEMRQFAFSNCGIGRLEIKNAVIGRAAYSGCASLKSVQIPGKVPRIPDSAFYGCSALEEVQIEEGVTSIGSRAFESCIKLEKITIPKSVTSISKDVGLGYVFIDNGSIKDSVKNGKLPTVYCYTDSVAHQFAKKNDLSFFLLDGKAGAAKGTRFTSGQISYKVTRSGKNPEAACAGSKKSSVTVPATVKDAQGVSYSVTSIGANAFKGKSLKKITIGKNVKTIGQNAFYGCKKLSSITIKSAKLSSVGKNCLKGISAAAKIKVPAKNLAAYQKLLKGKGQGKKVTIKKA